LSSTHAHERMINGEVDEKPSEKSALTSKPPQHQPDHSDVDEGLILTPPRPLAFLDAAGPPREPRRGADQVGPGLQGGTALGLRVLQVVDGADVAVDERGVREGPRMLGRLEFGRGGREDEEVDVLGHAQLRAGVPARPIQDEDELLVGPGPRLAREGLRADAEGVDADRRPEGPERAPGRRVDVAGDVAPLMAVSDRGDRALPVERPGLLEDGPEPDPVLVHRPQLDRRRREGRLHLAQERPQLFF